MKLTQVKHVLFESPLQEQVVPGSVCKKINKPSCSRFDARCQPKQPISTTLMMKDFEEAFDEQKERNVEIASTMEVSSGLAAMMEAAISVSAASTSNYHDTRNGTSQGTILSTDNVDSNTNVSVEAEAITSQPPPLAKDDISNNTTITPLTQQQQQEVVNILAMLQSGSTNIAPSADNQQPQVQQQGTSSNDKVYKNIIDVPAIPAEDAKYNNDDDDNAGEFSGGLDSREVSIAEGNLNSQPNPMSFTQLSTGGQCNTSSKEVGNITSTKVTGGSRQYYFGKPKFVQSVGKFPEVGSILGPFFCLGQLGKGTFSSIHKCVNMKYFHHHQQQIPNDTKLRRAESNQQTPLSATHSGTGTNDFSSVRRLAAAKVELVSFQKSGVLESEATILDFLHSALPPGTVPVYMGHFKSDQFAAIFMEYLPGEDMHQLREYVMAKTNEEYTASLDDPKFAQSNISPPTRRINVKDAVFLTADVMLPLLQRMHSVGVVHRDVKPSNCVRAYASGPNSKQFCMVDFGLSKSIIIPEDSPMADKNHFWDESKPWLKPYVYQNITENPPRGCYLAEREKADFRGTSMYASLRVHQGKDYCPRDDVWSLLYVFCDLVTGGLPWMQHAANRDRDACQRYKERIHGETPDGTLSGKTDYSDLLKGDIYHKAAYQREKSIEAGVPEDRLPPLPTPLAMKDENTKVQCLAKAFDHLAKLQFWEKPNYELIKQCIHGFLNGSNSKDPFIRPIDWDDLAAAVPAKKVNTSAWKFADDHDPLDDLEKNIFDEAEQSIESKRNQDDFLNRIPLQMRFRLAQMDYNVASSTGSSSSTSTKSTKHGSTFKNGIVPIHRALNDWLLVTVDLLYKEWDSKRYEPGGHRTITDGFKRECYLQLLDKCRSYIRHFNDFATRECMYYLPANIEASTTNNKTKSSSDASVYSVKNGTSQQQQLHHTDNKNEDVQQSIIRPDWKRRKVVGSHTSSAISFKPTSDLLFVSKCILGLEAAIKSEQMKKTAPPVRISFG